MDVALQPISSSVQKAETTSLSTSTVTKARDEINVLYTPIAEAISELEKRRADSALCGTVTEFHATLPPTFIPAEPAGFLFRSISTPNYEFEHYLSVVRGTGLRPLVVEMERDKFVSCNREKYRLCHPGFLFGENEMRGLRVVNLERLQTHPLQALGDLRTVNGMALPQYHRALREHVHPGIQQNVVDMSSWFPQACRNEFYYLRYLALFICHGILFENYVIESPSELRFTLEKVLPGFARAVELFRARPLIVALLPSESEHSEHWRCHQASLYPHAVKLLRPAP